MAPEHQFLGDYMSTTYCSFLLRCWARDGQLRIDVEHVQSGQQTRESSLAAVVNWIEKISDDLDDGRMESQASHTIVGDGNETHETQDIAVGHTLYLPSRLDG
jgi:hypothetical protein